MLYGTTTLFAAFDIATGLVKIGYYDRRRRCEFPNFMNTIVASYPNKEIYVILDNLNTHTEVYNGKVAPFEWQATEIFPKKT